MGKGRSARYDPRQVESGNAERRCVGVAGGDMACLRTAVRRWTGHPASHVIQRGAQVVRLADVDNRRDLVFLLDSTKPISPWPGGPLIWLYPERGPSEPELAQMRVALINHNCHPKLHILICLPHDTNLLSANRDLDIIAETLMSAVDPEVEMEIEAVWLSDKESMTLGHWLDRLDVRVPGT